MTSKSFGGAAARYATCYTVLFVSCALLGLALAQANGLLLDLALLARANEWVGRAVRQLSLPVLGLIWLVAFYWLEWYLRTGVPRGLLARRAARALVATACPLLVVLALRVLV